MDRLLARVLRHFRRGATDGLTGSGNGGAVGRDVLDRHAMRMVLAAVLPPDGHAIDIGAHRGDVIKEILRIAPLGHHIAYEPLPYFYDYLRREFPQVDVRNAALSERNGTSSFVYVEAAPEFSGLRERAYPGYESAERKTITVQTERLDDALPSSAHPSLIKIDVEGAELLVLRGAVETLRRHRPVVIFEHGIGAADHYEYDSGDLHDLICGEIGMRIFDFDGDGPYTRQEFIDIFPQPMWNFVAVPG
jgi:FkbM family methyltransferase